MTMILGWKILRIVLFSLLGVAVACAGALIAFFVFRYEEKISLERIDHQFFLWLEINAIENKCLKVQIKLFFFRMI